MADSTTTAAAGGLFKTGLKFGDIATAGGLSLLQAGIGYFADKQQLTLNTEIKNVILNYEYSGK